MPMLLDSLLFSSVFVLVTTSPLRGGIYVVFPQKRWVVILTTTYLFKIQSLLKANVYNFNQSQSQYLSHITCKTISSFLCFSRVGSRWGPRFVPSMQAYLNIPLPSAAFLPFRLTTFSVLHLWYAHIKVMSTIQFNFQNQSRYSFIAVWVPSLHQDGVKYPRDSVLALRSS